MDEELEEVVEDLEEEGVELPEVEDIEEEETDVEEEIQEEEEQEEAAEEELDEKELLKAALNAERKKRKELEKAIKKSKSSSNSSTTYDELVRQGVDKELAKTLAQAINQPNEQVADLQFQASLTKASKKAEFADIENYEDEVREFVNKGLTIEQAYYAATGGKKNVNTKTEIKREVEAKIKNQKIKSAILDIDTSSTVATPQANKLKYSNAELSAAKMAGMTIEEYKAMQKLNTVEDYNKYKKSKIKK